MKPLCRRSIASVAEAVLVAAVVTCSGTVVVAQDPPTVTSRPPPSFSHVRFFNGSSATDPTTVTESHTRSGMAASPATPLATGSTAPSAVAWTQFTGGWTDVVKATVVVTIPTSATASATITVDTPTLVSPSYVVELDVILKDAGSGTVEAIGKCLYKKSTAPYWNWVDAVVTPGSPVATMGGATSSGYQAQLTDVALLNNFANPLPVATTSVSYYSALDGQISLFPTTPVAVAGVFGIDTSTYVPSYTDVSQASATVKDAKPNKILMAATGERVFLAFLIASDNSGKPKVDPVGVVQTGTAPYWSFK